jgi:hypothetical protein
MEPEARARFARTLVDTLQPLLALRTAPCSILWLRCGKSEALSVRATDLLG